MGRFLSNPIRLVWLAFLVTGALAAGGILSLHEAPAAASVASSAETSAPVLVELFTSEGCSSCPPADDLLAKLDANQFVPGAQAIVLSEHVTYWDRLGWRDPFSLDAMTERQNQYVARLGPDGAYTPQMVVDGAAELVGSDERKLVRAVTAAAAAPKVELVIAEAKWDGDALRFSVHSKADLPDAVLVAALAEDAVQSSVARGENSGRTLHHVAVVRAMQALKAGSGDGRELSLTLPKPGSADPATGPVRLVVFAADKHNGHVLAVAERTVSR